MEETESAQVFLGVSPVFTCHKFHSTISSHSSHSFRLISFDFIRPSSGASGVVDLLFINPFSAKGLGDRLYATLHKLPGKSTNHFVYFWSRKTLSYAHLEATSHIPQQGQSLPIWITSLSTTGCYKNKYTIQFLWLACISRFATAILSVETELALGTIRVKGASLHHIPRSGPVFDTSWGCYITEY